ncbi:thiamine phosphate synthase [Flavobacterium sp. DSP2-3-1]|uniref:thiamine phosphate synthase n=1 Tax=Flavobacterium sp. DSP2-3-1 TaxID=2804620 RepID=UPI003CF604AD
MIVITNPLPVINEIDTIHSLFENGLELLHIRKPDFSETETNAFLSEIKSDFRQQLVLHSHHQLASAAGIHRIHFTEKARIETSEKSLKIWQKNGFSLSTSIHQMIDFEELSTVFAYAFFGPVFESISKPKYISNIDFVKELEQRKNNETSLVALGGITYDKIKTALKYGFDDVALLGTIWNSNHSIENFKLCQKIGLSY